MQRRVLVKLLTEAGFQSRGGTKHEKFTKDGITVKVKRHREVEDEVAKRILKAAGLR